MLSVIFRCLVLSLLKSLFVCLYFETFGTFCLYLQLYITWFYLQKEIKEISYKQRSGNWFLKAHLKVLKGSLCRMQGVICIRIISVSYQNWMCHLELQSKIFCILSRSRMHRYSPSINLFWKKEKSMFYVGYKNCKWLVKTSFIFCSTLFL